MVPRLVTGDRFFSLIDSEVQKCIASFVKECEPGRTSSSPASLLLTFLNRCDRLTAARRDIVPARHVFEVPSDGRRAVRTRRC